jgi:hypothetical protein
MALRWVVAYRSRECVEKGINLLKVPVIIPAFNAARPLRAAVASAQAQTGIDLEIIIIDDSSCGGRGVVVRELAAADSRVKPVALSVNSGPAAARNAGLRATAGEPVDMMPEHRSVCSFNLNEIRFYVSPGRGANVGLSHNSLRHVRLVSGGAKPWAHLAGDVGGCIPPARGHRRQCLPEAHFAGTRTACENQG